MQKNIILLSFLSMLLLAACNTTTNEPVNEQEQPTNITAKDENSELEKDNEAAQNNEEITETGQQEGTNEESNGKLHSITYTTKGKAVTSPTVNVNSSQQDYTINLLDGYTLTAEEPGRDMVLNNENNAVSMRIETFKKAEVVYEELLNNTKDSVLAIAPEGQYKEMDLTNVEIGKQISNIHTFHVELEAETVSTVLYEANNKFIRLTIFDDESDLTDAFLKMGLTIQ
ncbi:hypothetical protein [Solibacillus sp. CAU 1738]|uniref:hypothetical protein n=1 Tax=Solibacillus sp. CAU 1738 TaxID=3140363 RepID=UPI003261CC59